MTSRKGKKNIRLRSGPEALVKYTQSLDKEIYAKLKRDAGDLPVPEYVRAVIIPEHFQRQR